MLRQSCVECSSEPLQYDHFIIIVSWTSVGMSFPRAMPGRSPEKSIMINLGNKLRLRLDTSRSSKRVSRVLGGHLTPQRLIFGKDTDRT